MKVLSRSSQQVGYVVHGREQEDELQNDLWREERENSKVFELGMVSQQGFNFTNLLEVQGLSTLVQMKGTFYPELVKVFYTCAKAVMEGNLYSIVNDVEIVIDTTVLESSSRNRYVRSPKVRGIC